MAEVEEIALPRHDFYQKDTHVVVSLYVKGYGTAELKDQVAFQYDNYEVLITLPPLAGETASRSARLGPLQNRILAEGSSARVLSTKIELKLAKATASSWSSLLHSANSSPATTEPIAGPSSIPAPQKPSAPPTQAKSRRDWDKVVEAELEEKEDEKGPNGGGDAALQNFFNKIYAGASDDTKRAMIKSYTESGGTTLSTNWAEIGKEKTPIRPPDGMEARKY